MGPYSRWLCCIWIGAFRAGSLHGFCRFALFTFLSGNLWVLAERCAVLQAWLAYTDISRAIAVVLGVSFELGSVTPFALAANLVLVLWILVPAVLGVLCYYVLKGKWEAQLFLIELLFFLVSLVTWELLLLLGFGACLSVYMLAFVAFAVRGHWLLHLVASLSWPLHLPSLGDGYFCPVHASSVPAARYYFVSLCSQHDKGLVIFGSFLHSFFHPKYVVVI